MCGTCDTVVFPRNAIIVLVCLVLAMILDPEATSCSELPERCVFTLTGQIQAGLPAFTPPPFSTTATTNGTTVTTDFGGMVAQLGSAIIVIPLIGILESVAIAKAFGEQIISFLRQSLILFILAAKGKPVDASQEMLALGLCNIAASFVQSMPITGSFSRTAVNR